jgi:hypothetical protein
METTMIIPFPQVDYRNVPRALICARTVVIAEGKPATEHMVYDLSTGGARLCGLPHAQVGDEVTVGLQLPQDLVCARGQLLRVGSSGERPDFAVEFFQLSESAEDAIHDAVVEALSRPGRRSLLLVQSERNPYWSGREWLDPVSPICATATTTLEAVQCLEEHHCDVGIIGSGDHEARGSEWIEIFPEVSWRTLDDHGRLRYLC